IYAIEIRQYFGHLDQLVRCAVATGTPLQARSHAPSALLHSFTEDLLHVLRFLGGDLTCMVFPHHGGPDRIVPKHREHVERDPRTLVIRLKFRLEGPHSITSV